jgi:hypothetical protein
VPFSTALGIGDERALALLVEASGAGPDDTVLDVACGPDSSSPFARVSVAPPASTSRRRCSFERAR